ncbi:MAG: hypothetical protein ABFC96_11025 [Thermoguttaceae bacterium]
MEGPTDDPGIQALRQKKIRDFLLTLLFSQGVPMLRAGDETGHTQRGNNNAYCQDNEISWLNWNLDAGRKSLLEFTRRLAAIFHRQPVFHRRRFFHGKATRGAESREIDWFLPSGKLMSDEDWGDPQRRCLGILLYGKSIDIDEHGDQIDGDTVLLLLNRDHADAVAFTLPPAIEGGSWELLVDTSRNDVEPPHAVGNPYELTACSAAAFRSKSSEKTADL